ncbi:MAG: beta-N-acetylhexosaminidase, partial [Alphaproteobacteria bacterium]|nr:beta-N-acetylhexosaminidase [Alphaproteobacteria bacterium]
MRRPKDGGRRLPGRGALGAMTARAVLFGCSGPKLLPEEAAFFRDAGPWGFILFARNIQIPDQVIDLINSLRDSVGRLAAPVLIDQEGGRVARLTPPHWRKAPPAALFGKLFAHNPVAAQEACRINARLLADELSGLGVNVDCAPVLDVPAPGGHQIIGDRAFASDPETVAALGLAQCEGLMQGGVLPVIKHMPGHGRAGADSHLDLPFVTASLDELRRSDFAPFRSLRGMPLAMTAHVAYPALDGDVPASHSSKIIREIIRTEIGFDGVLMCDDLGMSALRGGFAERASKAVAAGCDVLLHCSGVLSEMREVIKEAPALSGQAARRCAAALAQLRMPDKF